MIYRVSETGVNVAVTATSTVVLAATPKGIRQVLIQNQGSSYCWLGFGATPTAADGHGYLQVAPGASVQTTSTGAINAICASGDTTNLAVIS